MNYQKKLKQYDIALTFFCSSFNSFSFDETSFSLLSKSVFFMKLAISLLLAKELTKDLINKFSILNGAKYFSLRIFENYLAFIPTKKYIKYFSGTTRIESLKSNRMSEKSIENITTTDSNFAPAFVDHHLLPDMTFNGHCLIKSNISIPKKVINLYIFYTLTPWLRNSNTDFTLDNCLFGSVT